MSIQSINSGSDQWARFMALTNAAKARNPGLAGIQANKQTQLKGALERLSNSVAAEHPQKTPTVAGYGRQLRSTTPSKILGNNFDGYA
ncbi:MAG: hypothetical protein GF401_06530 [Chitinivibrionales bacterium]|nr:hypothetical protein [Chitinivibrionales bacterium]